MSGLDKTKCAVCGHPRYKHGKNTLDCKVKTGDWKWCFCKEFKEKRI